MTWWITDPTVRRVWHGLIVLMILIPHPVASEHRWLVKAPRGIQCPGCLGQAVVTLRLLCAIVESPRRHKRVPFVNIASLRSGSIKRRQWKHKLDYYDIVFVHLATGCGINAKDPSGLDSDRWIPHSRCCENPARAKALAGFSRHLSAGFTDLNPAPWGLSLYNSSLTKPPFDFNGGSAKHGFRKIIYSWLESKEWPSIGTKCDVRCKMLGYDIAILFPRKY